MSPRVRLVPGVMTRVYEVLFLVVTQCFHCGFHLRMVHDRHIRVAERHERAVVCDSFISCSERSEKYLPFLFPRLCLPSLKFSAQEEWCFVSTRASRRLRNRTIVSGLLQHIYAVGPQTWVNACPSQRRSFSKQLRGRSI